MFLQYSLYQLLGLFLIYSFLGWCTEVCFVAVSRGEAVNRGFLNGPVCPIYGVGMIGVLILLAPVSQHLLLLFAGGMLLCSLVELAGGWVLERVFETRWWDYSTEPFNLGGYICLRFSILWGLAVTFVVRLVHPLILALVDRIPHTLGIVLLAILWGLFLADLAVTLVTIVGIRRRVRELDRLAEALHTVGDSLSDHLGNTALAADTRLDAIKESGQERMAEGKEMVSAAVNAGQEKLAAGREKVSTAVTTGQEKLAAGREKVSTAVTTGQEKLAAGREKVSTAVTAGQEKLADRVSETREELLSRRNQLEERRKRLSEEFHGRFGVRRLVRAFPDMRRALQHHLDNMDKE